MRRELGPWTAYALVAGSMIGTGIFFFVSPVAVLTGSRGGIIGVWLLAVTIAAAGAACVSELAAAYPRTGGIYVFLRRAYGPLVAFLYVWSKFLIMRVGSLGVATLAFADFTCRVFELPSRDGGPLRIGLALAALWGVTAINATGVRSGGRVQVTLTSIKVLALIALVAVAVGYAAGALPPHPVVIPAPATPTADGFVAYALALVPVMWTLGGWDESPFVAGELKDPERNLPFSVLGGLLSVGLLFVLVNIAYLLVLTPAELAGSGTQTATIVVERMLGGSAATALGVVLMLSTFGTANGLTLTGARIAFAAAQDHPALAALAGTGAHSDVPVRALLMQALLATAAICWLARPFDLLLYTAVAYWAFAALTALAVIVLRRREPEVPRPFRVAAYPIVPAAFTLSAVAMAVAATVENPQAAAVNVALLALGAVAYALQPREGRGGLR